MAIVNFGKRFTSGFDEDALVTFTNGEHVLNFGYVKTTGDLAEGIFAVANDVTVRNFGRVETNGLGAVGILVLGDDARIENYGSVVTRGGHFDFNFFSEGILAIGDRFDIANYGTVRVEGEFSSGLSVSVTDGLVINFGRVDCFSSSGVVGAVGDNSRAINAGHITTHDVDTTALFALGETLSPSTWGGLRSTGPQALGCEGRSRTPILRTLASSASTQTTAWACWVSEMAISSAIPESSRRMGILRPAWGGRWSAGHIRA